MLIVKPIWMQDYAPGSTLFTRPVNGGFISDGIIWFQNQDEVVEVEKELSDSIFPKGKGFSHVVGVVNEKQGIEATEKGIWLVNLDKYFKGGRYFVVCRMPQDLDQETAQVKINDQLSLQGHPYDFVTYPQFMINAIFKVQDIFPGLRKHPPFGHVPGTRVCSTLEAAAFAGTEKYKDVFAEWNPHRFHVHRLWKLFPYMPFNLTKERFGIRIEAL